MILRVDPAYERCVVARQGHTTWVWVRGNHEDLMRQLSDLDRLLRPDEVATIRAAYGWREGDAFDVLATPVNYVPPSLSGIRQPA